MLLLKKFLSPGGVIYLTIPNERSYPNALIDWWFKFMRLNLTSRTMPFSEPYHVLGFSRVPIKYLGNLLGFRIPFMICKYSYNHIERYIQPLTFVKVIKRFFFGIFHQLSDGMNNGMNLEAVFVKDK
jgi:hypothetical protein